MSLFKEHQDQRNQVVVAQQLQREMAGLQKLLEHGLQEVSNAFGLTPDFKQGA